MFEFHPNFVVQIAQIHIFLCRPEDDEGLTYSRWLNFFENKILKEEEVKGEVMSFPFFVVKMRKTPEGQLPRFFWLPST